MILQNAYATPDGYILISTNCENLEYFDAKSNKLFHICGGKELFINNITNECVPYFLTDDSTLAEIKSKLLWRTAGKKQWENNDGSFTYKPLIALESDHLKAILAKKHIPFLHKYIIGRILEDRGIKFRSERNPIA